MNIILALLALISVPMMFYESVRDRLYQYLWLFVFLVSMATLYVMNGIRL